MATITSNSGNINVSFFPNNASSVWFCDKNTGGINIATNGAAFADNTIQLGNLNSTTNVNGALNALNATFGNWKSFYQVDSVNKNYSYLSTQTGGVGLKNFALYQDGTSTKLNHSNSLRFNLNDVEKMVLNSTGFGIGTVSPICPLDIGTSVNITTAAGKYWSINQPVIATWSGSDSLFTSVKASGSFLTSDAFVSASDHRIKNNIVDIQDDAALQLFRRIQPKTYEYVDKVRKRPEPVYGFIAQEVREVLPLAVKVTTDTVPNLYTLSSVTGDILTLDPSKLEYDSSGNLFPRLKLIKEDNSECFVRILSVEGNTVQIDQTLEGDKVFVYGQEVNNFHTLNKDAIWTVASAALQELDRQLQAEKEKTKALEQNYEQFLHRILALESNGSVIRDASP